MNRSTTQSQRFPFACSEIFRLAEDARNSPTVERYEPDAISSIIKIVSAACDRTEEALSNERTTTQVRDFGDIENLLHEISHLDFPGWPEYASLRQNTVVLCPAVLRTGRYHDDCALPDHGGFMLRTLTWRYLAATLAVYRASWPGSQEQRSFDIDDARRSLIFAAKNQREMLEALHVDPMRIAGDFTGLAITLSTDEKIESFVVTIREIDCDVSSRLLSETATNALAASGERMINHDILLTGSISNTAMNVIPSSLGRHVHLVGNPDEVRFIVVVSDVPDHIKVNQPAAKSEGRFRLSKSRLRDALLGRASSVFDRDWLAGSKSNSATRFGMVPKVINSPVALELNVLKFQDQGTPEGQSEPSISRTRMAQLFSGYKYLE